MKIATGVSPWRNNRQQKIKPSCREWRYKKMRNKTLVKICGICDVPTAVATAEAGADFIGVVFYPDSKRNINRKKAEEIVSAIKKYKTEVVGVFVEQNAKKIAEICQHTGITIAQLHGDSAKNTVSALPENIRKIFVINVGYDENSQHSTSNIKTGKSSFLDRQRDYFLYDGENPGSGRLFNLDRFTTDTKFRFFLSGGLTLENVSRAIAIVAPFAVDVSSGVEKEEGVKDAELIKKFINKVKGT